MEIRKLAIVDDHQLFRQGLSFILKQIAGYEVVLEAASGGELFEGLASGLQPDVVLLDLHMPQMDGKEASRLLLAQEYNPKIIILSMDYNHDYILDLVSMGVHGYLPKDIDQRVLAQAIEQVCTKGYYIDDTMAQVMRAGLKGRSSPAPTHAVASAIPWENDLTAREKEVLSLLCQGYSSQEIAEQLFVSLRTVEGHRRHLLEKT